MRDTKLFAAYRAGSASGRRAFAGLLVLLLGAIVAAPEAPTQEVIGEPIVYAVPGMDDVRIERDIEYKTGPTGQLVAHVRENADRDDTGESRRIIAETVQFLVSSTALPPDAAAQDASDLGVRPFAPGSLPTGDVYRGMFSPDGAEFYYFRGTGEENDYRIHVISRAGDGWTASRPEELGGEHSDLYPTVSLDGETMVFASYRPFPGGEEGTPQANLWRATRVDGEWRNPAPLVGVSRPDRYESHPVLEPDGRLSFRRALPDWSREEPLVASPDGAGGWTEPVTDERIDRWRDFRPDLHLWGGLVHPDGDVVLLDVSPIAEDGRRGRSDLWVAERQADGWSDPQPLGAGINTEGWDNFPAFTPDGKSIVFVRDFDRFLIAPFNRPNMDRQSAERGHN